VETTASKAVERRIQDLAAPAFCQLGACEAGH